MPQTPAQPTSLKSGFLFGISAYLIWGFLPLFFLLLRPAGAFEVVAARILFSLVFCAILLTVTQGWGRIAAIVRTPRTLLTLGLAAALIFVNWQVYVFATLNGEVLQASLGYFINPIITVVLGVVVLRERLRSAQWVAVGISAVAVIVLAFNYGGLPWIALTLALSFGAYGLVKKRVGGTVDALGGLAVETAWLVPVAVVELIVVGMTAGLTIGTVSVAHTLLMASAGVITAIPLLMFAASARRLPLVYVGLIQYLTPILQFAVGAFVLHETLSPVRWFGFALVWIALIVLSLDAAIGGGRARRASLLAT